MYPNHDYVTSTLHHQREVQLARDLEHRHPAPQPESRRGNVHGRLVSGLTHTLRRTFHQMNPA